MKTTWCTLLAPTPDLPACRSERGLPSILFVILRRMVTDKVGDSLFYRFFHDLWQRESLVVLEHIGERRDACPATVFLPRRAPPA